MKLYNAPSLSQPAQHMVVSLMLGDFLYSCKMLWPSLTSRVYNLVESREELASEMFPYAQTEKKQTYIASSSGALILSSKKHWAMARMMLP